MLPPRGYIFIGLNIVRALSVISLILVFASSIFVLVTDIEAVNNFMKDASDTDLSDCDYIEDSTVPNQPAGVFWAVVNRLLIIIEVIVLILSEIGWPAAFFDRFFPVLGASFGLGPLGIFQCLIGATILSHHVDDFTLVAAFFLFAIGCLNMVLGLIFRESAKSRRSIFSWRASKGMLPTSRDLRPPFARPQTGFVSAMFNGNHEKSLDEKWDNESIPEQRGDGFGPTGERKSRLKGFMLSRPVEAASRYVPAPRSLNSNARAGTPEPHFKSSNTAI